MRRPTWPEYRQVVADARAELPGCLLIREHLVEVVKAQVRASGRANLAEGRERRAIAREGRYTGLALARSHVLDGDRLDDRWRDAVEMRGR